MTGMLERFPELKIGLTHEFLDRHDGWQPLRARYGLPQQNVIGIDHALGYAALGDGSIDVKDAYSTDAQIVENDLVVLVINLLFGGHDTSRSVLATALALLLAHPEALAALRRDPSFAAPACEEILRYEPPIAVLAREPVEDLRLGGVTLPRGEMVLLSVLSANRDAAVFTDPDRFDVARDGPRSLSFGWGPHHCLGAALARAELQEAIPALLECADFELAEAPRWVPFAAIRRLASVRVRAQARA
jgi:cytochrome P450